MSIEIVVQTANENGRLESCMSFMDLPADHSARVCVVSPDKALRDQLFACLQAALQTQGGALGGCMGGARGGDIPNCRAQRAPGVHQLVVAVVDSANPSTPALEATVRSFLVQPGARALGVLPLNTPSAHLPPSVRPFQASRYVASVCDSAEDVLAAAGADLEERKIFLSYSRNDAALALELTEALADVRFQVYLDTRSNAPASVWDEVLRDAIVDAALLVVIETAASYASSWVRKEIGLAQARGAGVLAVQPGAPYSFRTPAARFVGPPSQAGPFVAEQHRIRMSSQRTVRIDSVVRALAAHGVPVVRNGGEVHTPTHYVGVYERPVAVRQVRRTSEAARAAGVQAASFSPMPVLDVKRRDRQWMHRECGAVDYADGMLTLLSRRLSMP
jgi:TIR domain